MIATNSDGKEWVRCSEWLNAFLQPLFVSLKMLGYLHVKSHFLPTSFQVKLLASLGLLSPSRQGESVFLELTMKVVAKSYGR